MRLRHLLCMLLLLLAVAPASASATGWSGLGGGASRSGHDALDPSANTPVTAAWERVSGFNQAVRSGPVVSWGAPGGSRVSYGSSPETSSSIASVTARGHGAGGIA